MALFSNTMAIYYQFARRESGLNQDVAPYKKKENVFWLYKAPELLQGKIASGAIGLFLLAFSAAALFCWYTQNVARP